MKLFNQLLGSFLANYCVPNYVEAIRQHSMIAIDLLVFLKNLNGYLELMTTHCNAECVKLLLIYHDFIVIPMLTVNSILRAVIMR